MRPFALEKWYLDCTTDDGRTAIGYWTVLCWQGIGLSWCAIDVWAGGRQVIHRSSLRSGAGPARDNGRIRWKSAPIGCTIDCEALQQPFSRTLRTFDRGSVEWSCEAAAAHFDVDFADAAPMRGVGYAERLVLTIPPWSLNIDALRWGRWIASDGMHNMVWIDWSGPDPLTAVFADGVVQSDCAVTDSCVTTTGIEVALNDRQPLVARTIGDVIGPLGRVARFIPQTFLGAEERKWRSRGAAAGFGDGRLSGWAIHELVRFR